MRFLRWHWSVLVVVVLVGASCGGPEFPDEGDVPEEAFLAMPGAVEVESTLTEGYRVTDIDGRNRDHSSIQSVEYEIDGATGRDVYEWYSDELVPDGWEFSVVGTLDREGEPTQCRTDRSVQGYCGSFQASGSGVPGESMIISLELYLHSGVGDDGPPAGIAHIDDEIDGYRIRSLVEFAPVE